MDMIHQSVDEKILQKLADKYSRAPQTEAPVQPHIPTPPVSNTGLERGSIKAIEQTMTQAIAAQMALEEGDSQFRAGEPDWPVKQPQAFEIVPESAYPMQIAEKTESISLLLYESAHRVQAGDIIQDPMASISEILSISENKAVLRTPTMGEITVGPQYLDKCQLMKRGMNS